MSKENGSDGPEGNQAYSLLLDAELECGTYTEPGICLFHAKAIENIINS